MIVLDTNVLSELMRGSPAATVLAWLESQSSSSLYTTSITQAEVLYGVQLLPKGRRREAIAAVARGVFEDFDGRVLAFGSDAVPAYAEIAAARKRAGRPISALDAQIAAIARAVDATLATRNVNDFAGCGIELVDPWHARRD